MIINYTMVTLFVPNQTGYNFHKMSIFVFGFFRPGVTGGTTHPPPPPSDLETPSNTTAGEGDGSAISLEELEQYTRTIPDDPYNGQFIFIVSN